VICSIFVFVCVYVVVRTAVLLLFPFRFSNAFGLSGLGDVNVFNVIALRPLYVAPLVLISGKVTKMLSESEGFGMGSILPCRGSLYHHKVTYLEIDRGAALEVEVILDHLPAAAVEPHAALQVPDFRVCPRHALLFRSLKCCAHNGEGWKEETVKAEEALIRCLWSEEPTTYETKVCRVGVHI
jgi:hypothetical protein